MNDVTSKESKRDEMGSSRKRKDKKIYILELIYIYIYFSTNFYKCVILNAIFSHYFPLSYHLEIKFDNDSTHQKI